jgi:alanine-synthesizing transaminase
MIVLAKLLLACAKVGVSPALGFGEGYVRIALVQNTHRLRQAVLSNRTFTQSGTTQSEPAVASAAAS